jgi:hypothetical protein
MEGTAGAPRKWRWFLPGLLILTSSLKLALAWTHPGFLTGDDFEIVAAGARQAAGFAYTPWEIRSMFHPFLLVAPLQRLGVLTGFASPRWLSFLAALPTVAFSTLGVWVLFHLARELSWSEPAARAAAFLYALHPLALTYGATQFPRPISTCLLLGAFLLVARGGSAGALGAGALVAAAAATRWSEGLMLLPLLGFSLWRNGRARTALQILGGFGAGFSVLAGLLDIWTRGQPFASFAAFLRLGRDPRLAGFRPRASIWYGTMVLQWAGPLLLALSALAWRDRRSRVPLSVALAAIVLFSFSPLKQMRYMQAAVPFLALPAALGWERLRGRAPWRRWAAAAIFPLAAGLGLERTLHTLDRKSQPAIDAAAALASLVPPPRVVALEQMWAYGEKLYLGSAVEIRDLAPRHPLEAGLVRTAVAGADAAAFYREDVDAAVERSLADAGMKPCGTFARGSSAAVVLYVAAPGPCPAATDGPG